ncbi:MAG TPA: class IV adenylate cyclase [Terriglobales bacterium]|nr:class IV adenylate cyclase [Terriglobales bacterium]
MNNETEIKFLVANVEALRDKLRASGFREETPRTHEMNTLYDTPQQDLRNRCELLRIRKYGETWIVTHKSKGRTGRHKMREEIETRVADGEELDAIFRALGYAPSFRYEKYRAEWTDGEGHVVVDETPIGNVAEIEGKAEWIDSVAEKLGVRESDYITKNYATMFEDWKQRTKSGANEMTWKAIKSTEERGIR